MAESPKAYTSSGNPIKSSVAAPASKTANKAGKSRLIRFA